MAALILKLLRIHRGETSRVVAFAFLGMLLHAGIAIGISVADSVFLTKLGTGMLPYLYLAMPVVMLVFIPIYTYWMNRIGVERLFDRTMLILVLGGLGCFLALGLIDDAGMTALNIVLLFLIKLYPFVWLLALTTLYWNLIDGYFDIIDAKRLFAFFAGGLSCGAVLGGSLVSGLSGSLDIPWFFVLWAGLALLCLPVVRLIRRRWKRIAEDEEEAARSVFSQARVVVGAIGKHRFILLLNLSVFLIFLLTTLVEFQYFGILSEGRNEQQLAALFGSLFAFVNIFNLLVNFFLFNRLVGRLGVRNLALVQPLVYLGAFLFLHFGGGFDAALFGFFAYQGLMLTIDQNNMNFLFNAVPPAIKRPVRSFTEGIADPLATALAGGFLLFGAGVLTDADISLVGSLAAVLALVVVLALRRSYRTSLTENLRSEWLDFSRSEPPALAADDPAWEGAENADPRMRAAMIGSLCRADQDAGLLKLISALDEDDPELREALAPVLAEQLDGERPEFARGILEWLHEEPRSPGNAVLEVLAARNLLASVGLRPDQGVALPVARLAGYHPEETRAGLDELVPLLAGTGAERRRAIRAIGRARVSRYAQYLVRYLDDPDGGVRHAALDALAETASPETAALAPELVARLDDFDREELACVIRTLARINDAAAALPLLARAERLDPPGRRALERLLAGIGLRAIPVLVSFLRNEQADPAGRSIAARSLGALAFAQFEMLYEGLVRGEIGRAYRFLDNQAVLAALPEQGPGARVLAAFYRDSVRDRIRFILEMLAIAGRLPDFELIGASIRSGNPKARANAIETLEQGIPNRIFRLLLPLVDSRPLADRLVFYHKKYRTASPGPEVLARDAIEHGTPLEAAAALQYLRESNAAAFRTLAGTVLSEGAPLASRTAATLLAGKDDALTLVDKIDCLKRSVFFKHWQLPDLQELAAHALPTETPGDTAALVVSLQLNGEGCFPVHNTGCLFAGTESLPADAAGPFLLVPAAAVLGEARVRPAVGPALLETFPEVTP